MKAKVGSLYQHYKNQKTYKVLSIARHTETLEEMVVYEGQYDDPQFGMKPVWVRPLAMFEAQVKADDGLVHRFIEII